MIARLKALLDSSVAWLFALVLGLAYFWKKERDLEVELAVAKNDEKTKELSGEAKQIDSSGASAVDEFKRLDSAYLRSGLNGVSPSGGGAERPDPDPGSGTEPGRAYVRQSDEGT